MRIFPTIELMDGRAVTLRAGSLDEPQIWIKNPIEVAQGFVDAGAEIIQITDFDALRGSDRNEGLILDIIRGIGRPVQIAGGIRSREKAEFWYNNGANSIVVSSWAVQAPDQLKLIAKLMPDWAVLGLDVCDGKLLTQGWRESSALSPEYMLEAFADVPLASVLITDVNRDRSTPESPSDGQLGLIGKLASSTKHSVIVSGVAYELDDVSRLKAMPGVDGVLIARALFNKTFELEEALSIAVPDPEPTAVFQ